MVITETDFFKAWTQFSGSLGPILWLMHLAKGASGS